MAFQEGYASNEFELQEIIDALLRANGWTLHSRIDDFDCVYFSSGIDGYKDIYVRVRAGLAEIQGDGRHGGRQYDVSGGDGYTGYLNFFAYQWFPEGGDGYDGYGEAGKFGPRLYWFRGNSGSGGDDVYYQNFMFQAPGSRRWTQLGDHVLELTRDKTSPLAYTPGAFDGVRNYFSSADTFTRINRYNIMTGIAAHINQTGPFNASDPAAFCYYYDKRNFQDYIYIPEYRTYGTAGTEKDTATHLARIELNGEWMERGMHGAGTVWPSVSGRFIGDRAHMIWDGGNNLYHTRGRDDYFGGGSATTHWAKYHIPTDTWTLLTNAPFTFQHQNRLLWLDKRISNFANHRIYTILQDGSSNRVVYYIDIDPDNGLPVSAWTSAGNLPSTLGSGYSTRGLFFHNGVRFFAHPGTSSTTSDLWYADIAPTSLTWISADSSYFPATVIDEGDLFLVDGYKARVKTSLRADTKYWAFVDRDHLCVVTKILHRHPGDASPPTNYKYSYCYAGAINTFTGGIPTARTTLPIYPGLNVEIPIDNIKGEFEVGQRMFIADTTGGGSTDVGAVDGIARQFAPIEKFTITDVTQGVSITANSISNIYQPGSRVGIDPQPIGVTFDAMDRIQMLNVVNTVDAYGGLDRAESMALLESASDDIVNASGGDARRGYYYLWPISVVHGGTESSFSGKEARGQLIGVFAVASTATDEKAISVGTNSYIVFPFSTSKEYKFAIGPTG